MPVGVRVQIRGQERYARALQRIQPSENPQVIRRAFGRSGDLLEREVRERLQGPRPRRLDEVTGELARSVTQDRSRLERQVEVGVPARLFWFAFHELGLGPFPKRPAVLPALEDALSEIPGLIVREWEGAA